MREENNEVQTKEEQVPEEVVKEMLEAGVVYGHLKRRGDPRFSTYLYTTRNGLAIIDVAKTYLAIKKAANALKEKAGKNTVLMVATQPQAEEAIKKLNKEFGWPYLTSRWLGGFLTNFPVVYRRIEYFRSQRENWAEGKFEKYTKKERLLIKREIDKMTNLFEGLDNLVEKPEMLFVIDPSIKGHQVAVREAMKIGIPTVAIIDSDDNPEFVDYPIPANDHTKSSIDLVVAYLIKMIKEGN